MKAMLIWLAVFALSTALLVACLLAHSLIGDIENRLLPGTAGLILLAAIALTALVMIQRQFTRQQNQIRQVLKSLMNKDSNFSLPGSPDIQPLLKQVQQEIGRSRKAAEIQASYLKALIAQLDISVLEFDAESYIVQSTPAAERLLGLNFLHVWRSTLAGIEIGEQEQSHLQNIKVLRKLVNTASTGRRGELTWHYANRKETLLYTLINGFNQGKQRTLLTLQSIEKQLAAQEVKAHQQLVKVLTHEVANSITPMVSLTQSAQNISAKMLQGDVEGSDDLAEALATITRRGQHLTHFIQSFKALSEPVNARLSTQTLRPQITLVLRLLQDEFEGINVEVDIAETLEINLDPSLFEHVLINLLKNASEATAEQHQRRVQLCAQRIDEQVCLDIIDNGSGVNEHAATSIFVPFFTTKSGGTGIGLPLARSLMI